MTRKDESRPQEEGRAKSRKQVSPANDQLKEGDQARKQGAPEPGTEGPEGHIDDQPQREDEYLSHVLKEFNPQRKDENGPSENTNTGATSDTDRQNNGS